MFKNLRRGFLSKVTQKKSKATGTRSDEAADTASNNGHHPNSPTVDVGYRKLITFDWEASNHPSTEDDDALEVFIAFNIPSSTAEPSTTEVIARLHINDKILSTPGYPSPLPILNKPPAYKIKHTGTVMGLGMFVTRDINPGDLILVERALFMIDLTVWVPYYDVDAVRTIKKYGPCVPVNLAALKEHVPMAFERLSEENKKNYLKLAQCEADTRHDKLVGIFTTNAFGMLLFEDMEKDRFGFVAKELSRINHSCVPNCMFIFNIPSFAIYLRAGKTIKKGEQIFLSYRGVDDNFTFAARKSFLQKFSITCKCHICSLPPDELAACDAFRTSLESRIRDIEASLGPIILQSTGHHPAAPIGLDKNKALMLLDEVKFISREIERWGMEVSGYYLRVLKIVCAIYVELCTYEDSWQVKAQEARRKAETLCMVLKGKREVDRI
ncbi:hypothetical protein BDQ17DRAFT_1545077 [Cyathus striatus]|nr:hypothetical protein BDQ17DRAFT_1545077 [Cyathus striatus]